MKTEFGATPVVSIVILNFNGQAFLENCLASVFQTDYPCFEVILVDNGSSDNSIDLVQGRFGNERRLRIVRNRENLGFALGNNLAIRHCMGDYLAFLNVDTIVDRKWLTNLVKEIVSNDEIAVVQPKIKKLSDRRILACCGNLVIRYCGWTFALGAGQIDRGQFDHPINICLGGAAFLIQRRVVEEIGLFDSKFFINFEDTDLSLRVWLSGYKIAFVPQAVVYHHISGSWSKFTLGYRHRLSTRNCLRMMMKNYNSSALPANIVASLLLMTGLGLWLLVRNRDSSFLDGLLHSVFWNSANLGDTISERRSVQGRRKVTDAKLQQASIFINPSLLQVARWVKATWRDGQSGTVAK